MPIGKGQMTILDLNDIVRSTKAPASPYIDALWIDTSVTPNQLKSWNGSAWITQTLSIEKLDPAFDKEVEDLKTFAANAANDGILTPAEKINIRLLLIEMTGDTLATKTLPTLATLDSTKAGQVGMARAEAITAGASTIHQDYVDFGTAYTNLKTYLEGLSPRVWESGNTTIVAATWTEKWDAYYDKLSKLAITTSTFMAERLKPNTLYNGVMVEPTNGITVTSSTHKLILNATSGITIQKTDGTKQFYTNTDGKVYATGLVIDNSTTIAGTAASTITTGVNDMISDLKVSPLEKQTLQREWQSIKGEYTQFLAQAQSMSVATTAFINAYNALNGTAPKIETDVLANLTTTYTFGSTALRDSFRTTLTTYRTEAAKLQKAVSDKMQTIINDSLQAAKDYVISRGENIITNGNGMLGNNTNFSGFTFDSTQVYAGKGSFKTAVQNGQAFNDEFIPINPSDNYRLSMMWKGAGVGGKNYIGTVAYDIDKKTIDPTHFYCSQYALGELAKDLKVGDTVIYLKDSSMFIDNNEAAANGFHSMAFYGYKNSYGYEYPAGTYTRTVLWNGWATGKIDRTAHTITLKAPFAITNPSDSSGIFRTGHKVSRTSSGGTFQYTTVSNKTAPTSWTKVEGMQGGFGISSNTFPHGTAFIKLLFLFNRNYASEGGVAGDTLWVNDVQLVNTTLEDKSKAYTDIVDEKVKGVTTTENNKTVIDGAKVKTGSIVADKLNVKGLTVSNGTKNTLVVSSTGEVTIDGKVSINSSSVFAEGYDPSMAEGGLNVLVNSRFSTEELGDWLSWGTPSLKTVDSITGLPGFDKAVKLTTTGNNQGVQQKVAVLSGKKYTASTYVFSTVGQPTLQITNGSAAPSVLMPTANVGKSTWVKISVTFTAAANEATILLGKNASGSVGTYWFTGVKLEEGDKSTGWTASQKDLDKMLEAVVDPSGTVKGREIASSIAVTPGAIELISSRINLKGKVTFEDLANGWSYDESGNKISNSDQEDYDPANPLYLDSGGNYRPLTDEKDFLTNLFVKDLDSGQTLIDGSYIQTGTLFAKNANFRDVSVFNEGGEETFSIDEEGNLSMMGTLRSGDYVKEKSGWSVESDGKAEFNSATFRGDVMLGYFDEATGVFKQTGGVQSGQDTTGPALRFWAGTDKSSAPFKVFSDGTLYATEGNFNGTFSGVVQVGNIKISDDPAVSDDASIVISDGKGVDKVILSETTVAFNQNVSFGNFMTVNLEEQNLAFGDGSVKIDYLNNQLQLKKYYIKGEDTLEFSSEGTSGKDFTFTSKRGDASVLVDGSLSVRDDLEFVGNLVARPSTEKGNKGLDFIFI